MRNNRAPIQHAAAIFFLGMLGASHTASADWTQYNNTTRTYSDTANWDGGVINDTFDSSSTNWAQTINVTADRTLTNGLTIIRNPTSAASGNVVFQGSGGDRTFTLGGDLNFTGSSTPANAKLVQLGLNTAGQRLILDLGDTTRTFDVATSSYDDASRGYGFVVFGPITGSGGLTKTGNGTLAFWGTNTSTFTGPLTINNGRIFLTDKVQLATEDVRVSNTFSSQSVVPTALNNSVLESSSRNVGGYGWGSRLSPTTTLTMNGGMFKIFQSSDPSEISAEQVANLVLEDGLAQIDAVTLSSSGKAATFTIDNLSRPRNAPMAFSVSTNYSNYAVSTNGFGDGAGQFKVAIGNYDAGWSKGGILPFAVIGNYAPSATLGTLTAIYAPAAYDAGGYVKAATVTTHTQLSDGGPAENVKITPSGNDFSVANGTTAEMNSLLIASSGFTFIGDTNAGTVKLTSGQLVYSPSGNIRTDTRVTLDMNGEHAYLFASLGRLEVQGQITNATGVTFAGSFGRSSIYLGAIAGWTGETTIASGSVEVGSQIGLPTNSRVNIASGALLDGPFAVATFGSLAGAGALKIENGQVIGADNTDSEFSGQIYERTGSGSYLTKVGTGTLTLSGESYYTGTTTVVQGRLVINGNHSAATGAVTVATNAALGGSGTIGGATTISGIHSPGNSPGVQTFTNGLTYNSGSSVVWELIANGLGTRGTDYDGVDVTGGTLDFAGTTTLNLTFNLTNSSLVDWNDAFWGGAYTGTNGWLVYNAVSPVGNFGNLVLSATNTWVDSSGLQLTSVRTDASFSLYYDTLNDDIYLNYVVPEPSTYALLALAAAGLGAHVMRRRRR